MKMSKKTLLRRKTRKRVQSLRSAAIRRSVQLKAPREILVEVGLNFRPSKRQQLTDLVKTSQN